MPERGEVWQVDFGTVAKEIVPDRLSVPFHKRPSVARRVAFLFCSDGGTMAEPSRALTVRGTSGIFPRMSTLIEIEAAILELPPQEKSQLVDWLDEHRDDIAPVTDEQRAELRLRQSELIAHPELAQPLNADFFTELRRKVADVRTAQTSAR